MSRLNGKAKEVLDACLSAESPEVRSKIYEIVDVSGLEANDPMFLILALTGQMRVLLEAAPAELTQLLTAWREQSARSLQQIEQAVTLVLATQQQQADTIKQTIERVTTDCVEDIKEVGMATTGAIADANGEVLNQSKATLREAQLLNTQIKEAAKHFAQVATTNQRAWQTMLEQNHELTARLQQLLVETNKATVEQMKLTNKLLHVDIKVLYANLFGSLSPLVALLIAMLVGGLIANVLRG
jgi:hypothetical protein